MRRPQIVNSKYTPPLSEQIQKTKDIFKSLKLAKGEIEVLKEQNEIIENSSIAIQKENVE